MARKRRQAHELSRDMAAERLHGIEADHDGDPDKADQHPRQPVARHLLVRRQEMGEQHGEQRRRGIEDRGDARGDVLLAADNEREGDGVVDEADAEEGSPDAPVGRQLQPHGPEQAQHQHRCHGNPPDDHREHRQFLHRHGIEEERAAPQQGQEKQPRPLGQGHRPVGRNFVRHHSPHDGTMEHGLKPCHRHLLHSTRFLTVRPYLRLFPAKAALTPSPMNRTPLT
jgi:hypothetical protein